MTIRSRRLFKKKTAVFVCSAFIFMSLPGISYAGTKYHSPEVPFLKKCSSVFPTILSLFNINSPYSMNEYSIMYVFSKLDKKPSDKKENNKEKKDSYDDHGNSTSRKPANDRD